jgi:hypothetical protein
MPNHHRLSEFNAPCQHKKPTEEQHRDNCSRHGTYEAVSGSPGPQGAATDVSALRVGSDRSWPPKLPRCSWQCSSSSVGCFNSLAQFGLRCRVGVGRRPTDPSSLCWLAGSCPMASLRTLGDWPLYWNRSDLLRRRVDRACARPACEFMIAGYVTQSRDR